MKKKVLTVITVVLAAAALVGCSGEISNDMISISQYKGLEVEKVTPIEVTDAEVEASIQSTLYTLATRKEIASRPVQKGDLVTIDYLGKVDGVAFEGGADEDYDLEIGSGSFIDGFEDAIIGHNVGEVFDITVTFPEQYTPELAGKEAVFTITLDKITEVILPELTDDLVKQLSSTATTVDEYKEEEKQNLQISNEASATSQMSQSVWQTLVANCTLKDYPEEDLNTILTSIEAQYGSSASYYGMGIDEFIKEYFGITMQDMAENLLKRDYAVQLIAEKEGLTLNVEEYEEGLAEFALQYGYSNAAELEEMLGHDQVENMLLQRRVEEWLIENCKQVD